jgi:hypothetical protein
MLDRALPEVAGQGYMQHARFWTNKELVTRSTDVGEVDQVKNSRNTKNVICALIIRTDKR